MVKYVLLMETTNKWYKMTSKQQTTLDRYKRNAMA